ncbi:Putative universal stress protein [Methanimicrococcus stummii]|uniref:Universal stress protein n=1 Tax=Methanimicrococcus stummii TaxID=3028294 RepID=A0AA96VH97_9EURY|nr:universal stress protein [Methanimicrococcus sp. Es2]WNY28216.1 Putative universal stress protein [Methanimicrococcus sp. Es2]
MTGNLYNTIVVGTDGTEYAKKAINTAVELAKLTGAKLYAVYVSDVSNITPTSVEWEMVAENIKLEADAAFEFVRDRAGAENVDFDTVSLSGAAAQEIVQYANQVDADLIVVGATGKKAIERLILGSVSEKVIRNAKQQVLVVRSDGTEFSE